MFDQLWKFGKRDPFRDVPASLVALLQCCGLGQADEQHLWGINNIREWLEVDYVVKNCRLDVRNSMNAASSGQGRILIALNGLGW